MICEYAAHKDPNVFAAVLDHGLSKLEELKETRHKYPMSMFDVASPYMHAVEGELCFFEARPEGAFVRSTVARRERGVRKSSFMDP